MYPTLFGLVPTYSAFLALAIASGTVAALRSARTAGIGSDRLKRLAAVLVGAGVLALLGAKLNSVGARGSVEPLVWELGYGYRYPGGIIALALLLPVVRRISSPTLSLAETADMIAPAIGVAMAVTRLGCFLAGCCHGSVSSLPWALSFPAESYAWTEHVRRGLIRPDVSASLPVHPLQLYFALLSLALAFFLFWYRSRKAYNGRVFLLFLALDNTAKFLLEFWRDPRIPHLQWASLAIALLATAVLTAQVTIYGGRPRTERRDLPATGPSAAAA